MLTHILPIATFKWWFLTDYVIIMVLSPFINRGINELTQNKLAAIIGFLFFTNSIGEYFNFIGNGSDVLSLLILYLIGRYLRLYPIKKGRTTWSGLYIISTMLLFVSLFCCYHYLKPSLCWWLLYYKNPLIVCQAISLLMLVLSFRERHNKVVNLLGKHCLSIYLITELIKMPLYGYWARLYDSIPVFFYFSVLLCALLCIFIDNIQERVNNYILVVGCKYIRKR